LRSFAGLTTVVQLTAVRRCSHLKREISNDVTPYVLSCKSRIAGRCYGVIAVRWDVPLEVVVSRRITCILSLVCCVLHEGSPQGEVALACLAFLVIVGAFAAKVGHDPDTDGALITAHGDESTNRR